MSSSGKIYVVENRAVLLSGSLVEFDMEGNRITSSPALSALGCELLDDRCLYAIYGHYITVVDAMKMEVVGQWGINSPVYAWGGGFGITADRQGYLYTTLASTTVHYYERWRPATVQTKETTWGRIKATARESLHWIDTAEPPR